MRRALTSLVLLLLAPASASANRTLYGWLYGTDTLPERGAELGTWVSEKNDLEEERHSVETRWWVAPAIGINDQLELLIPLEVAWDRADGVPAHTAFDRWGAEMRYRFVTSDSVDAPPLVPLLRVAMYRDVLHRDTWNPELDAVASYDTGPVQMLVDLGGYAELSGNVQHYELRPGVGVSVKAVGDVRFGAEVHAELSLDDNGGSWAVAGPNMAWTHGRFWLSAMYGIGIYKIKDAPKVQWGIAF